MFYFFALLNGILVSITVAQNGALAGFHGLHFSSVVIHTTGLIVIAAVVLIKRDRPFANRQAWYLYAGGAIGVFTVVGGNFAFGRISVSAIMAISLLGQSVTGLVVDQYGWLGMPKNSFNKARIAGLILTVAGIVVMTDRFDLLAIALSFVAGISIVFARTLNARLAESNGVRISTFFNYVVGLAGATLVFTLLGRGEPIFTEFVLAPASDFYIYFGGFVGVFTILINNITVAKISAFYLSLLMFIGQVFTGVIIDALIDRSFSIPILIGGSLVAAGFCADMLLSRKKPARG